MVDKTFKAINSRMEGKEDLTLARAVRFLVSGGGGTLIETKTGQMVWIDMRFEPINIYHIEHGYKRGYVQNLGSRLNERGLLLLIGKQVQRFTGKPVIIEDSEEVEITFGGLVDSDFERLKTLPKDRILEVVDPYNRISGYKSVDESRLSIGEILDYYTGKGSSFPEYSDEVSARKGLAKNIRMGYLGEVNE